MDSASTAWALLIIVVVLVVLDMLRAWLWSAWVKRTRKPERIRWIQCDGCMGNIETVQYGTVVREYVRPAAPGFGYYKDEVFLEIKLDNGDGLHFPKRAFNRSFADGVLEHRY